MAGIANVGRGDVSRRLKRGREAAGNVTFNATAYDLRVVDRNVGIPGERLYRRMTSLANIGAIGVIKRFGGQMTCRARPYYLRVVNLRHGRPSGRCMAKLAGVGAVDMRRRFTDNRRAVVAVNACYGANELAVVDSGGWHPSHRIMAVFA